MSLIEKELNALTENKPFLLKVATTKNVWFATTGFLIMDSTFKIM